MRQVILFIAMSVDGYIADECGGVDWLSTQEAAAETADFYGDFIAGVETVFMGRRTYEQVINELSQHVWPYDGLETFVFSHRPLAARDGVTVTAEDPVALVKRLRAQNGGAIWICGGASLAQQMMAANLIDEWRLSVIPVVLGNGVRLFVEGIPKMSLCLVQQRAAGGIVELTYRRRL